LLSLSSSRCRQWVAAVAAIVSLGLGSGLVAPDRALPHARAQQDPPASSTPAPATGPGPEAATEGDAEGGVPRVEATESFIHWMFRASGPIGVAIVGMSFYLIALVAWMTFQYRKAVAVPEVLVREVTDLLGQKQYTEAYQRLAADRSFLARVLAAGVRKLPTGLAHAQRAMELANDDVTMEMEHRTTYLATVGTLGPMIGLVGTVYGMILSFRVIATAGASPQASQLAGGISTALFATLEGIALSIPAIYFYAVFRNRIARLSLEVELTAESLLEQFSPGIRAPHPLAATVAVPPSRSALPPSDK
jgi:biopolymer transport protein ExbB